MSFEKVTQENIQSYFQYLENVKCPIIDLSLINCSHLNEIINIDEDFLKLSETESIWAAEKYNIIFQRLMFLCEKIEKKEYDIKQYDLPMAIYYMILKKHVNEELMNRFNRKFDKYINTFWTVLVGLDDYYEYKKDTTEGRDTPSTGTNQISETSSQIS